MMKTFVKSVHSRAPRGMGWDEKNRPMGQNFSSCPMGWDSSQNFHPTMGWDTSKKFFVPWDGTYLKISVPSWDGILLKIFRPMGWDDFVNFSSRPIPSHPIPSHVIPWDGMGQYTHQISFIKNKIS
jgi:hypothetical protein